MRSTETDKVKAWRDYMAVIDSNVLLGILPPILPPRPPLQIRRRIR